MSIATIPSDSNKSSHQVSYGSLQSKPTQFITSYISATPVVEFRNVPPLTTETQLRELCYIFGRVHGSLVVGHKQTGFIQMESSKSAVDLVKHFTEHPPSLGRKQLMVLPSKFTSIVNSSNPNEKQNRILLLTIKNIRFPVNVPVLHKMFIKYGFIEKIVTFAKAAGHQALIQYREIPHAVQAKTELDGKNVYTGCCTLQIQYSKHTSDLKVKYNDDKSRDYTNPSLPPRQLTSDQDVQQIMAKPSFLGTIQQTGVATSPVLMLGHLAPKYVTPDILFNLFSCYGNVTRIKILFHDNETGLVQFEAYPHAIKAQENLDGIPFFGKLLEVRRSKHHLVNTPKSTANSQELSLNRDFTGSKLHRFTTNFTDRNALKITRPSNCLLVENLPPNYPDHELKQLFKAYGTVENIKMLRETNEAIVAYSDLYQAVYGLVYLSNTTVDESHKIRVVFSKERIPTSSKGGSSGSAQGSRPGSSSQGQGYRRNQGQTQGSFDQGHGHGHGQNRGRGPNQGTFGYNQQQRGGYNNQNQNQNQGSFGRHNQQGSFGGRRDQGRGGYNQGQGQRSHHGSGYHSYKS